MVNDISASVINALCAALIPKHQKLSVLINSSAVFDIKYWPDGSLWFKLKPLLDATPLTPEERWNATGTDPCLAFEVCVDGEIEPLLGVVWFDDTGLFPTSLEVNVIVEGSEFCAGKLFSLHLSSAGNDPLWFAWEK